AYRRRLIAAGRPKGTRIMLDQLNLDAGATVPLCVPADGLAWLQVLGGEASLAHSHGIERLSEAHVAVLPPGFEAGLSTSRGASLLHGRLPETARLDPEFAVRSPAFRVVDWTREPVLDSQHDARKRIYLITPKLFGTRAIKAEMIIYPPGTKAANHHH